MITKSTSRTSSLVHFAGRALWRRVTAYLRPATKADRSADDHSPMTSYGIFNTIYLHPDNLATTVPIAAGGTTTNKK